MSPIWGRGAALAGALGLATLLATAGSLEPDPAGMGTHRQLGLPPCSVRVLWGVRCPACGMTTSWAYFARGRWIASARANTAGLALAISAVGAIAVLLRAGWTGTPPSPALLWIGAWTGMAILGFAVAQWMVRLAAG